MYSIKKCQKGFTIIELVTVFVIIGIIVGIAIPTFDYIVERQKIDSAVRDISHVLKLGRLIAVKRGRTIDFTVDINGDGKRDNGYCLFVDKDSSKKVSTGDEIIEKKEFEKINYDMAQTTVNAGDDPNKNIKFRALGTVESASVFIKDSLGKTRKITISILGKVNVE